MKTVMILCLIVWSVLPYRANAQTEDPLVGYLDPTPVPVNLDAVRQLIIIPHEQLADGQELSADFRIFIDAQGHYVSHIQLDTPNTTLGQWVEPHLSWLMFTPALDSGRAVPASLTFWFSASMPRCTPAQDTILVNIQYEWDQSSDYEIDVGDYFPEALNLPEIKQRFRFPHCPAAFIAGKVIWRLWVDEAGRVVCYKLVRSPHPCLSGAIEPHLLDIRFRPTGRREWVTVPFDIDVR